MRLRGFTVTCSSRTLCNFHIAQIKSLSVSALLEEYEWEQEGAISDEHLYNWMEHGIQLTGSPAFDEE